ncbi:hypothetical protein [Aurantimonas phage AmM-1]|uniref:hypothetical protein n=1 Tax=Aurantimonas phage AmM-1 TaxID=1503929 RepID=UPI0005409EF1|nr:hypothetical protein ACQ23_gp37 [Aurantimonas phage AmM-1]BAP94494.1 hypothetical protein [Aurantimonas phage AmM-1]
MTHPEKMVTLAEAAMELERRPADAAALLIDAAAMIGLEANMDAATLRDRMAKSAQTLASAREAVEATGAAASRRQ